MSMFGSESGALGRRLKLAFAGLVLAAGSVGVVFAKEQAIQPPPPRTKPLIGTIDPDPNRWGEIGFVDVNEFPYDGTATSALKRPPLGPTSRTIFQSPEAGPDSELPVGQLIHLVYLPTTSSQMPPPGAGPHYHQFWEWGYTLKGDAIMPEPVSPEQKNGMLYRKREGGWLTRPPFSLHGGSWATGGMRNQLPYHLIIFEEGDGHVIGAGPDAKFRGRDGKPPADPALADWRAVKRFTRPWLLDSTRDVDWEDDPVVPGRFVKWLDDDMANGFRAQLVKIPPGWVAPPQWRKTYFDQANRLRYMVWGEMRVWQFKNPSDPGKPVTVTEDYFIYQPPRAIWGYGSEPVSERGAIWLEVTYAKGLKHGGGPIEEPKKLN
jgi:hypothetical protein